MLTWFKECLKGYTVTPAQSFIYVPRERIQVGYIAVPHKTSNYTTSGLPETPATGELTIATILTTMPSVDSLPR